MKHQLNNVFGGLLTSHLVATPWMTARRGDGETWIFDWSALVFALAIGTTIVACRVGVVNNPTRSKDGIPPGMYFFTGSVALLAATGAFDARARWCFRRTSYRAASLAHVLCPIQRRRVPFLGQQQVFPALLRKTDALVVPAILPLILMIVWLLRVRFTNTCKKNPATRGGDVCSTPTWHVEPLVKQPR